MTNQIKLKFDSKDQTSPIELSQFLQLFVTTYRALERVFETKPLIRDSYGEYVIPNEGLFGCLDLEDIKWCLEGFILDNDPKIISIQQQSPIEIAISGSIIILTIAAVISGGPQKIALGPVKMEFNLRSLGDSIRSLRLALSKNASLQTGNEFKGGKIKLNKDEYLQLTKPVNRNGGFQRFLGELQAKAHKRTRVIELSNRDIEKILKYKTEPSTGGFQSRFNKIFRRHFP